jgi:hypothetical protein
MQVESWRASVCVSSGLFYVTPRVFFVGSFALKPRTNLAMNFVRRLSAKVRVLAAMIWQLNPGKRLKINSHDSGI